MLLRMPVLTYMEQTIVYTNPERLLAHLRRRLEFSMDFDRGQCMSEWQVPSEMDVHETRNPTCQDHVAARLPRIMHAFLAVSREALKFECSFICLRILLHSLETFTVADLNVLFVER